MKAIKLFITAFILLILFCCKKEKPNLLRGPFYGNAGAEKNGSNWKADFVGCQINSSCYNGKLGILFFVVNEEGFLREILGFDKIPINEGKYNIYRYNYTDPCIDTLVTSTFNTNTDDGDVSGNAYDVLTNENNYINITNYNPVTKEIRGNYQVSFLITLKKDPLAPDTLRFTNGNFYTKILE